jgi:hypothetical protein
VKKDDGDDAMSLRIGSTGEQQANSCERRAGRVYAADGFSWADRKEVELDKS